MINIERINNKQHAKKNNTSPNFKGVLHDLVLKGAGPAAVGAELFVRSQESLSAARFIQDTAINWTPKAVFSRGKEDLAEQSFLEFVESGIFYFMIPFLSNSVFKNGLFKNMDKKNLATKAGMVLACTYAPVAEYTLSFAKNLFTLKAFKKSNFNSIANLDKNQNTEKEDKEQQERVEKSAIKHFKMAGVLSALGIAGGLLLASKGKDSKIGQKISKAILEPGKTLGKFLEDKCNVSHENKFVNFLKNSQYCSLNFQEDGNGKLGLGKGQLALTVLTGIFGYINAAGDRGKMDKQEVMTRVPLSGFYTIVGSDLFESAYIKKLKNDGKYPELIKDNEPIPKLTELIDKYKNNQINKEQLTSLVKQKAKISSVPFLFSLIFMGFSLALVTRLTTQIRYNNMKKQQKDNNTDVATQTNSSLIFGKNIPDIKKFISGNNIK